ncbi:MAG: Na/Pi cotransporter family protein [Spirochaetaceae bacterium]|nr:MAG: Na/Pi cotransporter family protein [Spirochaetaceae bacterium]
MQQVIIALCVFFGALGLFVTGYNRVSAGIMRLVGPWFRNRLGERTATQSQAFMTGLGAGAGSGVMSPVVSLVSLLDNGAVEIKHRFWVLLGINLGATFVYWLLALAGFRLGAVVPALALIALSLPLPLHHRLGRSILPDLLFGLALLILGIDFMSGRTTILPNPDFRYLFETLDLVALGVAAPAFGVLLGVALSALIRSSVGTTVAAMSLLIRGWLPFDVAAGIVLGANVGAALSSVRAASALNVDARRTAMSYLAISLAACIWAALLVSPLVLLSEMAVTGTGHTSLATQLALFSTVVHFLNPFLLLPMQRLIGRLVERITAVTGTNTQHTRNFALTLLPESFPEALNANLFRLQSGLARMAELSYDILMIVINATQVGDDIELDTERVIAMRDEIKALESDIAIALTTTVQLSCSREQAEWIQQQQRTAQQLSLIADDCYKTIRLLFRSYQKNYRFHQESRDELFDFTSKILDFLKYNSDFLEGKIDKPDWAVANSMEERIDKGRDKLKQRVRKVLKKDDEVDIKAELVFIDIVSHLEHVGDRCLSIAESVRTTRSERTKLPGHKE